MLRALFNNVAETTKVDTVKTLIDRSSPRSDFFFMMTLSVLMATFGILIESPAVVIGSMLIAPMLYPVLSIALGITVSDYPLILRSIKTILKSVVYALVAAAVITLFFAPVDGVTGEGFLFGVKPTLIDATIAVVAGLAASFATVKKMNETLPGVAISVSLIPPLAMIGVGIAQFDWTVVRGSSLIFITNVIGVVFASTIVFSFMNFYTKRQVADQAVKKDEQEIKKEKLMEKNEADGEKMKKQV